MALGIRCMLFLQSMWVDSIWRQSALLLNVGEQLQSSAGKHSRPDE